MDREQKTVYQPYQKESIKGKLTSDEPNLTGRFLVGTSHHGSHCIVHYGHDIQVKFLKTKHITVYVLEHSAIFNRMMLLLISHLSPLDGLSQQSHHVFSFTVCCLEALGPCNQDALHTHRHNIKLKHFSKRIRAFHCLLWLIKFYSVLQTMSSSFSFSFQTRLI